MDNASRAVRRTAVAVLLLLSPGIITRAPAFQLTGIHATPGGAIQLQWQSQSNAVYRVEFVNTLTTQLVWTVYYSNYPSHGTNTFWMDAGNPYALPPIDFPGDRTARFYRVALTGTNSPAPSPQITVVNPPNGAVLTGAVPITVSLSTSSNVSGLRLFVDGAEVASSPAANTNFTCNTFQFWNGTHQIFAVAGTSNQTFAVSPFKTVTFSNYITDFQGVLHFSNLVSNSRNRYRANFASCADWSLTVTNQTGVVRTLLGTGPNMAFEWDGTDDSGATLPNGAYDVVLSAAPSLSCYPDANWYVRAGATGANNGVDWNNAWHDVTNINWSGVQPGDTIWLAGGVYGRLRIEGNGSPANRIYVKRARSTNAVPVNTAGWKSSYDSTPILNLVACNIPGEGNYVTLDGQIPYAGIIVTNTSVNETYAVDLNGSSVNYVELRNLDIGGVSTLSTPFSGEGRCISANAPLDFPARGLHVAWCKLHGEPTLILTGNQRDMIWEHNLLYDNVVGNPEVWHPNVWNSVGHDHNCTFRYNDISNYMVECFMFSTSIPNTNWMIYGNFIHDATPFETSRILEAQYTTHGPVYLYNNTFVNLYWGIVAANDTNNPNNPNVGIWTNCVSANNLFINAGDANFYGFFNGADDYLLTDEIVTNAAFGPHCISGASSNVFVNYAGGNYRIVTNLGALYPRNQGVPLPAPFTLDFDGKPRGADGAWDIGASEAGP